MGNLVCFRGLYDFSLFVDFCVWWFECLVFCWLRLIGCGGLCFCCLLGETVVYVGELLAAYRGRFCCCGLVLGLVIVFG